MAVLLFLANVVISLVSFSVNFTTRREEHTVSGVEVGHKRNPADDRNEIKLKYSRISSRGLLRQIQNVQRRKSPKLRAVARRKGR